MKFSELSYQRPDLKTLRRDLTAVLDRFQTAPDYDTAESAYLEMDRVFGRYMTQQVIANIRRDIDTRDPFYEGEKAWYNQVGPELQPLRKAWVRATLASPFRSQLEKTYGTTSFLNNELSLKTFSPEIIPDLQLENQLVSSYTRLLASAQIPFEGKVYTLAQLAPFKEDPDDGRRLAAWEAEGQWYRDHGEELDTLYDRLVQVRDKMGRALGFDGYTGLGYCRMQRNCYGEKEVAQFREAVRKYLVPVAEEIYRAQAKRLGKDYPMNFADNALTFRSGNPRPVGNPEEILEMGSTFYRELSPETDEFWRAMREMELMDVLARTGKAGGGYCTRLQDYHMPFIFASFNGTSHDVKVITHEAGHAFAVYLNRFRSPADSCLPSLEGCEVHSMSMEFFSWPWAEGFFGSDARKFRYSHLAYTLTFIPYGVMVDHFQHRIYAEPNLTPQQRHEVWRELLGQYMPWVKLGEIPFYGEAMGWQRQSHIYNTPFYYIDYCLAQTVALEFWAKIQKDPQAAFQDYLRYTRLGGSQPFTELLQSAGLESPFQEHCLQSICQEAFRFLEAYDLTGIA